MSDAAVVGSRAGWRDRLGSAERDRAAPDVRRLLQLALAGIWLLDGVLQYQSFMYTKAFGQMLAGMADGQPGVIARPITWDATWSGIISCCSTRFSPLSSCCWASGIAWRPTVRLALAASIAWSLGVWWFGEGLGRVLTGGASPVNGAPGAVILYALLAVLLWPADRPVPAQFRRRAGRWRSGGAGAVADAVAQPGLVRGDARRTAAPQDLHDMIAGMADGEPGWVAAIERNAAWLWPTTG